MNEYIKELENLISKLIAYKKHLPMENFKIIELAMEVERRKCILDCYNVDAHNRFDFVKEIQKRAKNGGYCD